MTSRIYSEFVERYGGNISETKSAEIAYVSDGFEKLSAMLRSNPDQQTRAKDYLAKLKAEEPVTK